MTWYDTQILEVIQETPTDRTFRLALPEGEGASFAFIPGQFLVLTDPAAEEPVKRAYSLSSAPEDAGVLEVTVRDMGGFGHFLYGAETGLALQTQAPQGRFVLKREPGETLVLVGGGSGITPFRSFVRHLRAAGTTDPVVLFQSAQQPAELIFRAEFEELAEACPWFDYRPTVTRAAEDDPWAGRRGRIDGEMLAQAVRDPAKTRLYACGPGAFVKAQLAYAESIGIPKEQLHREQWG